METTVCPYCDGAGNKYDRRLGNSHICGDCYGTGEIERRQPSRTAVDPVADALEVQCIAQKIFG